MRAIATLIFLLSSNAAFAAEPAAQSQVRSGASALATATATIKNSVRITRASLNVSASAETADRQISRAVVVDERKATLVEFF